jgi:hypothetical protein
LTQSLIKWEIKIESRHLYLYEIELKVFKKISDNSEWNLICSTSGGPTFHDKLYLCGIKLFNDNNIAILTTQVLLI